MTDEDLRGLSLLERENVVNAAFESAIEHVPSDNELGAVDSLDDMQPVPRAGKFFAERIYQEDVFLNGVLVKQGDRPREGMAEDEDVRPRRARVVQLGPKRDGEPWDIKPEWDVIVPYHAGQIFTWMDQAGVEESLWIIDTNEVLAVYRPR